MKKLIYLFLFFFIFISPIKADNLVKFDYVEDIYYVIKLDNYYFSHKQPIIYVDEKLVYCLEPEKKVYEEKEYQLGNIKKIGLTTKQVKQIELIGHYGYGYTNHSNYKYYLAAQELIWEITRPNISIYWTNEEYGNNQISLEKEKQEIMYFVNTHYEIPSLNGKKMMLENSQKTITTTDKFIQNYEIYDSGPHNIQIKNNEVLITTSDDFIGKYVVKFRKIVDETKGKTEIYNLENYQSLIYTYNTEQKNYSFTIDIELGSLTIKKIDSETLSNKTQGEATLKGTIFELYNKKKEFINSFTLDDSGVININDLKMGIYYIKEIKAGKGYILNDDMKKVVISEITPNPIVTIKNDVIKSDIKIEKTYGSDYLLEEGAEFLIKDKSGNENIIKTDINGQVNITLPYGKYQVRQIKGVKNHQFINDFEIDINENSKETLEYKLHNELIKTNLVINKKDKVTGELILDTASFKIYDAQNEKYLTRNNSNIFTTEEGVVKIDDLYLGKYIVEEKSAPYGYLKGNKLEIDLKEENIENNKIDISYFNEAVLGKIEILKKGINYKNEQNNLDNVKFGIFAKEDIVINNKTYYQKDELVEELITSNGIALSKYIPVGKYYVKELETIKGYKLDDNIYELEVIDQKTNRLKLTNYMLKSKLIINKLGTNLKSNNVILDNVKLGIFAKEDIIANNEIYYKKDELIEEVVTKNGQAVSSYLPIGNYYVKELETINGYYLNPDEYDFTIKDEENVNLTIYNKIILGKLKIKKIGVIDKEEILLDDVKFGIFAKEDIIVNNETYYKKNELVEEIKTEEGFALLENLPIGSYYIKELEMLDNYKINDEVYCFEVQDETLKEITIYNYLKEEVFDVFEIPDTEIKQKKINKLSAFLILLFGYVIIKYAKK